MENPAASSNGSSLVRFIAHDPKFHAIVGDSPTATLLVKDPDGRPMYHEACIYHPPSRSIIVTSNQIPLPSEERNEATCNRTIKITRIYDDVPELPSTSPVQAEDITPSSLSMANGGVNYGSGILICAQGNKNFTGVEGIVQIPDLSQPHICTSLLSKFHGRPFNSVNDVIVNPLDGSIWFTDPCYGYHQGFRPKPMLPNQVYRFEPATKQIRAMADGFDRPNGLCFSPDCKTLYVTDTGAISGDPDVPLDQAGKSHIYAFDVVTVAPSSPSEEKGRERQRVAATTVLTNRRLFAYAPGLLPDGIKCDTRGNIYSGCTDGVGIWDACGVSLGVIEVDGGVANFCFGEGGALYICNEMRFWKVQLSKEEVKGALLGI